MSEMFALMIENACEDFEVLQSILRDELVIGASSQLAIFMRDSRSKARIMSALAKSFVFFSIRARRICEREASSIPTLDSLERRRLLSATRQMVLVRDVNEHGAETDAKSKEQLHPHRDGGFVGETAMAIFGPDEILMGPLNLAAVYPSVTRVRELAGFRAIARPIRPNP